MTSVPTVNERTVALMADETGIVLPYEKDAMAGLEMPDGLSYPDPILNMECPVRNDPYYPNAMDRDTATTEKKK